ncbi:DnaJ domain-containing protein, partial [Scleroderma yunnanense]
MPSKKPDYYVILGLVRNASDDEIRAAYKKLALQWHPDRHLSGKEHAAQKFIEVNTAYHALMDGKESTHSASAEGSSAASVPTSKSNTASASTTKSDARGTSEPSSRPSSSSSKTSKRTTPPQNAPSSTPSESQGSGTAKSNSGSKATSSPHSTDGPNDSRARSDENKAGGKRATSDHMKRPRNASKSHDHLRAPPTSSGRKNPSPSAFTSAARTNHSDESSRSRPSKQDARPGHRPNEGVSRTNKPVIPPSSSRLHKASRLGLADDFIQKLSKGSMGKKDRQEHMPHSDDIPPFSSPLRAMRSPRDASKEWLFPLQLSLEEIFGGSHHRFLVKRVLLSCRIEEVEIHVHVPAGTRTGTRIVCPRAGHQRKDGTFHDVVFLVEDEPDQRFSRVKDDLHLDICVPWEDTLVDGGGEIYIEGIDGKEVSFILPYPIYDHATEGQVVIRGAGMPIRHGHKTVGRGDMIIRCESQLASSMYPLTF